MRSWYRPRAYKHKQLLMKAKYVLTSPNITFKILICADGWQYHRQRKLNRGRCKYKTYCSQFTLTVE